MSKKKNKFQCIAGRHKVGRFTIQLVEPGFDYGDDVFATMISDNGVYVNPIEKFALFKEFGTFERTLTLAELEAYNDYVCVKHLLMPVLHLHKSLILDLVEILKKGK